MTSAKAMRLHRRGEIVTAETRELIARHQEDRRQESNAPVRDAFANATSEQKRIVRVQAGEIRCLRARVDEITAENEMLHVRNNVLRRLLAENESMLGKRVTPTVGYVDRLSPHSESAQ